MSFELFSNYEPAGDQPEAIRQLVANYKEGETAQVLLGVTGSGKTYTMQTLCSSSTCPH